MKRYALLILMAALIAGCTSVNRTVDCTVPLDGRAVAENLGPVKGSDHTFMLLWYMIGRPEPADAIAEALEKKGGDALLNARIRQVNYPFIAFTLVRVTAEGEAVKLIDATPAKPVRKGK
jgi:hypothetical protein